MCHECQEDNFQVTIGNGNNCISKYSLKHRALDHTEQQSVQGPKMTSVKQFKQGKQRSNVFKKRETRTNI